MTGNENYEELKETTKTFLQVVTSNDFYYVLFLIALLILGIKLIDLIFLPFKKRGNMLMNFLKGCLKVFVVVTIGMRVCSMVPVLEDFTTQILMSSSLIVVVLGFVFQEGLSNIVHGFILSIFKPFQIGDRVTVYVDGREITGYIETINVRQTIIRNVLNSSLVIIPNAKMDTCIIQNNYFGGNQTSSSFLDVDITYESDLKLAMEIIADTVAADPRVAVLRQAAQDSAPIGISVRALGESAVCLRTSVVTRTVEENFAACSDIRKALVIAFQQEPAVDFAYPHLHVVDGQQ